MNMSETVATMTTADLKSTEVQFSTGDNEAARGKPHTNICKTYKGRS